MATSELGGPVEERERCDGTGRVVGVVQPQDRRAVPCFRSDALEIGQEAGRLQGKPQHLASGEPRAALGDGVAGCGHDDEVSSRRRVEHRLRQREDRLLAAERGDDVGGGVERHAEPPAHPRDDRLAQFREARGTRVDDVGTIAFRKASRMSRRSLN